MTPEPIYDARKRKEKKVKKKGKSTKGMSNNMCQITVGKKDHHSGHENQKPQWEGAGSDVGLCVRRCDSLAWQRE